MYRPNPIRDYPRPVKIYKLLSHNHIGFFLVDAADNCREFRRVFQIRLMKQSCQTLHQYFGFSQFLCRSVYNQTHHNLAGLKTFSNQYMAHHSSVCVLVIR